MGNLSISKAFDQIRRSSENINSSLGTADDFLRLPESGFIFAAHIRPQVPELSNIAMAMTATRSVVCTGRIVPQIGEIVTGKTFRLTDKESILDLILRVLLAIGRFLSPLAWFHRLKAIDLGKHVKWVGPTIMSVFAAANVIAFVHSLNELTKARKEYIAARDNADGDESDEDVVTAIAKMSTCKAIAFANFLEIFASPWDCGCFTYGPPSSGASFGIGIAGSVINFTTSAVKLALL